MEEWRVTFPKGFENLPVHIDPEPTPEVVTGPIAKALYKYNPEPLRRELLRSGFYLLRDPYIQAVLGSLWWDHFFDTEEGREARDCLNKLFRQLGDPLGRPATPAKEKKASNRQRVEKWRQKQYEEKAAKAEIERVINEALRKLPTRKLDDREAEICTSLTAIAPYTDGPNANLRASACAWEIRLKKALAKLRV